MELAEPLSILFVIAVVVAIGYFIRRLSGW